MFVCVEEYIVERDNGRHTHKEGEERVVRERGIEMVERDTYGIFAPRQKYWDDIYSL